MEVVIALLLSINKDLFSARGILIKIPVLSLKNVIIPVKKS
jgi:hypothetical protein